MTLVDPFVHSTATVKSGRGGVARAIECRAISPISIRTPPHPEEARRAVSKGGDRYVPAANASRRSLLSLLSMRWFLDQHSMKASTMAIVGMLALGPAHAAHRILPASIAAVARGGVLGRPEGAVERPALRQRIQGWPETGLQAGQESGPQCRGLGHLRPLDRRPDRVGQPLHQRVVHHHAAVDAQLVDLRAIAAHRLDELAALVAGRINLRRAELRRPALA